MNVLRIYLLKLILFIFLSQIGLVLALQEYDFSNQNGSNAKQLVIKEIDRFYKAIEFDDIDEIEKNEYKQYLKKNIKSKYGNSALEYAIRQNSRKIINYLLYNIDFNKENENIYGENALMMAAFMGNYELVQTLINVSKVNVNRDGWSPIHYAVIKGNLDIVKILLKEGVNVDALTPDETTPLMLAIRYGHIHVVKLLLDKGADLSAVNKQDLTPIDFARMYNQREIARGLESRWFKLYKTEYEPLVDELPFTK